MMAGQRQRAPKRQAPNTDKGFKCNHPGCDKSFFLKQHLYRHQRQKHGAMYKHISRRSFYRITQNSDFTGNDEDEPSTQQSSNDASMLSDFNLGQAPTSQEGGEGLDCDVDSVTFAQIRDHGNKSDFRDDIFQNIKTE